jgi:hypothetical protein
MNSFYIILLVLTAALLNTGQVSAQTETESSLYNFSEGDTTGRKVAALRNVEHLDFKAERRKGRVEISIDINKTGAPASVFIKLGTTPVKGDLLRKRITEDVLRGQTTDEQVAVLQNNTNSYLVLAIDGFAEYEPGLYFIEVILSTKEPNTYREKQEVMFYSNEL